MGKSQKRGREQGGDFPFSRSTHLVVRLAGTAMAFTFAAFCYMLTLVLCAALIFFVIWQVSRTVHTGTTLRPKWAHVGPADVHAPSHRGRQTHPPTHSCTTLTGTQHAHTSLRYSGSNDMQKYVSWMSRRTSVKLHLCVIDILNCLLKAANCSVLFQTSSQDINSWITFRHIRPHSCKRCMNLGNKGCHFSIFKIYYLLTLCLLQYTEAPLTWTAPSLHPIRSQRTGNKQSAKQTVRASANCTK